MIVDFFAVTMVHPAAYSNNKSRSWCALNARPRQMLFCKVSLYVLPFKNISILGWKPVNCLFAYYGTVKLLRTTSLSLRFCEILISSSWLSWSETFLGSYFNEMRRTNLVKLKPAPYGWFYDFFITTFIWSRLNNKYSLRNFSSSSMSISVTRSGWKAR